MKTIERFIICVALIILVCLTYTVCGCKEKAEAKELTMQEVLELFEQVLDHEDKLIEVVGICIERIEKLEEFHETNEPKNEIKE